ncbi:MAG: hypothetical protein K5924_03035 [Chloroflexi bacterium]|nr:hypothetical protein [Chloroflexota bacterium]
MAALLSVGVGLVAAALIVALGIGLSLPGGVVDVPGRFLGAEDPRALPQALFVLLVLGLSVAASALAWSAGLRGARAPRLTLGVVALIDAALAGATVSSVGQIRVIEAAVGQSHLGSLAAGIAGAAGLAISVMIAVVPLGLVQRRPRLMGVLAAIPPVLVGGVYLALGATSATLSLDSAISAPDFPAVISAQAGLASSLRSIGQSASLLLAPFVIWQAATWARASGGPVGQRVADRVADRPWGLWALLTAKLGWLVAGYLGVLPAALGGWSAEWRESLEDGPIGWALALAVAGAAGWWLSHPRRRRISRAGIRLAALWLALGFASGSLALGALGLLVPVATALPLPAVMPGLDQCGDAGAGGGPAFVLLCLQLALADWLVLSQIGTVLVAIALGIALIRRRRAVPIGYFLVAVGAWSLPRALNAVRFFVFGDAPAGTDALGSVELATLDAAITLMVGVLAWGWWMGRRPRADPWVLALVLVVVTLMTRGSTLIMPGWSLTLFYVALVFPLLYELGLDSQDLNEPAPNRPTRVLHAVGLRAGALTLLFVGLGAGFTTPDDDAALVAFVLFAPPFAAWLVAGVVSARSRADASARMPAGSPPARRHLAFSSAAGVLVLALLIGVSSAASPLVRGAATAPQGGSGTASEPRSERARGIELLARDRAMRDRIAALLDPSDTLPELQVSGTEMVNRARAELAWMGAHPPASCSLAAWDARREEMLRLEELGTTLQAIHADEARLAAAEMAIHGWFDAQEGTIAILARLVEECAITAGG